jgi:periplasmic divalent cation tolerance protein
MSFSLLYVTHPSKPEAVRVTVELMNARLIACANYYATDSVYWWEGRLMSSTEVMTIYKTRSEHVGAVQAMIVSLHKYEVPCIIHLAEVTSNQSYEDWIQIETIPRQ